MSARRLWASLALLLLCGSVGCVEPEPGQLRVAGPVVNRRAADLRLRILESGQHVDLDRTRRELARYFDAPRATSLFDERKLLLEELPTPSGCAWLRVADEVRTLRCLETPLGRLVLCRTDDGSDLRLSDFETTSMEWVDGAAAIRLSILPHQRKALEHLTRHAAGSSLLFVTDRTVRLAVSVDGSVTGDLALVGLEEWAVQVLLGGS